MSDPWLTRVGPERPGLPTVICFPHAGGGAGLFRQWSTVMPHDLNVVAVQPPGRENRRNEPSIRDLPTMLDGVIGAIAGLLDRPFALFGHSIGSLIAFETVRLLRRLGGPAPACLAVSAFPAPSTVVPLPLHKIPDAAILRFLRGLSYLPNLRAPELMTEFLRVLRADFEVVSTYRCAPEPPLASPIEVFGGQSDTFVRPEELEKWREHTDAGCSLHILRGGHFYLHEHREEILCQIITASLRRTNQEVH
jgi:medium-chain acyl-[acyl-carrier-protein] hydrolase